MRVYSLPRPSCHRVSRLRILTPPPASAVVRAPRRPAARHSHVQDRQEDHQDPAGRGARRPVQPGGAGRQDAVLLGRAGRGQGHQAAGERRHGGAGQAGLRQPQAHLGGGRLLLRESRQDDGAPAEPGRLQGRQRGVHRV